MLAVRALALVALLLVRDCYAQTDSTRNASDAAIREVAAKLDSTRSQSQRSVALLQDSVRIATEALRREINSAKNVRNSAIESLARALAQRIDVLEKKDSTQEWYSRELRLNRIVAGERLSERMSQDGRSLAGVASGLQAGSLLTKLVNPFDYSGFVTAADSLIGFADKRQKSLLQKLIDAVRTKYVSNLASATLDPLLTLLVGPTLKKEDVDAYVRIRERFLCISTQSKSIAGRVEELAAATETLRAEAEELAASADSTRKRFWSSTGFRSQQSALMGFEAQLRDAVRRDARSFDAIDADLAIYSIGEDARQFELLAHASQTLFHAYESLVEQYSSADSAACGADFRNAVTERAKSVNTSIQTLLSRLSSVLSEDFESAKVRSILLAALRRN
jgi:hypothetical protein